MLKALVLLLAALLLFTAGSGGRSGRIPDRTSVNGTDERFLEELRAADPKTAAFADEEFLDYVRRTCGTEAYRAIFQALIRHMYTPETWHARTGKTALVLYDEYSGALDPDSPAYRSDIRVLPPSEETSICIVGDVSFADNYEIMPAMNERGKGLLGVLSREVVDVLRGADILMVNSEFAFTTRGAPISGKTYTFRGDPGNVKYLLEMGTDIVTLANNHVYDYGEVGFADTLETFRNAGIPYIGAGEDIDEASRPFYFIQNGRKYAFTAATRAEKRVLTPEATEISSGVLRMYDMTAYLEVLREAERQCDVSIAYVHWGAEKKYETEDGLYEDAVAMIEAGADAVVGAHAHLLQEISHYEGVPIVFNLGNFLFDELTLETAVLRLTVNGNGRMSVRMIPCLQEDRYTRLLSGTESERVFRLLRRLSPNVSIDSEGNVSFRTAEATG